MSSFRVCGIKIKDPEPDACDAETRHTGVVRLKLQAPENQNVRVPNKRERVVEVVTDDEGQKRWKSVDRDGVLERGGPRQSASRWSA